MQSREYFGRIVDLIIDGGIIIPEPSSVISLVDDNIEIIKNWKRRCKRLSINTNRSRRIFYE